MGVIVKMEEFDVRSAFAMGVTLVLVWRFPGGWSAECGTVNALVSSCSTFVNNGSPDPLPGSPCCVAMTTLTNMADSGDNRRTICRCFMALVTETYNPNATAIATLPGFCGVSLGFTIDPNTDCD